MHERQQAQRGMKTELVRYHSLHETLYSILKTATEQQNVPRIFYESVRLHQDLLFVKHQVLL